MNKKILKIIQKEIDKAESLKGYSIKEAIKVLNILYEAKEKLEKL